MSLFSAISWYWWAIGLLGGGGGIAFFLMGPVAFLAFLRSPLARALILAIAIGVVVLGIFQWGQNTERRKWEALAARRALEIMQKDIAIGKLSEQLAAKQQEVIDAEETAAAKADAILEEERKKLGKGRPAITDDEARSLRYRGTGAAR